MGFENKNIVISPETIEADRALLAAKLQTVRGICVEDYEASVFATASLFYGSVFEPQDVVSRYHIQPSETFSDRIDTLESPVQTLKSEKTPHKDEFIRAFTKAWTNNAINAAVLYPEAQETLQCITEHGPTVIWTQGDMYGVTASHDGFKDGIPGTFEQMKKVAGAGVGKIRRDVAKLSLAQSGILTDLHRKIQDTLTVVASEDKFSETSVNKLVAYLAQNGAGRATIIDDRVGNIQKMRDLLAERGIETTGIWVRQGRYGKKDVPYDQQSICEVPTVGAITADLLPEGSVTICDFDDVFSDQSARTKMQRDAIYEVLVKNDWIAVGDVQSV